MNRTNQPAPSVPEFSPELIAAMKRFRSMKPWRGSVAERKAKFTALHLELRDILPSPEDHPTREWTLSFHKIAPQDVPSAMDLKCSTRTIQLYYKLSVVTYLYAVGVVAFRDRQIALAWAQALYRKMFPVSAANTITTSDGLILKRTSSAN